MKQTAIEWLEEQMKTWGDLPRWMRDDIVNKAKEMEKEQMEELFKAGINYGVGSVFATEMGEDTIEPNFEQYYNETFKQQEQ